MLCLLRAVAMAHSGVSGRGLGQVWLSPEIPSSAWLPAARSPVTLRGQTPEPGVSLSTLHVRGALPTPGVRLASCGGLSGYPRSIVGPWVTKPRGWRVHLFSSSCFPCALSLRQHVADCHAVSAWLAGASCACPIPVLLSLSSSLAWNRPLWKCDIMGLGQCYKPTPLVLRLVCICFGGLS